MDPAHLPSFSEGDDVLLFCQCVAGQCQHRRQNQDQVYVEGQVYVEVQGQDQVGYVEQVEQVDQVGYVEQVDYMDQVLVQLGEDHGHPNQHARFLDELENSPIQTYECYERLFTNCP